MIWNAATLFVMVIGGIFGAIDPVWGFFIALYFAYLGLSVTSFLQISIFQPGSVSGSSETRIQNKQGSVEMTANATIDLE